MTMSQPPQDCASTVSPRPLISFVAAAPSKDSPRPLISFVAAAPSKDSPRPLVHCILSWPCCRVDFISTRHVHSFIAFSRGHVAGSIFISTRHVHSPSLIFRLEAKLLIFSKSSLRSDSEQVANFPAAARATYGNFL